jgi:hypothetical protein
MSPNPTFANFCNILLQMTRVAGAGNKNDKREKWAKTRGQCKGEGVAQRMMKRLGGKLGKDWKAG